MLKRVKEKNTSHEAHWMYLLLRRNIYLTKNVFKKMKLNTRIRIGIASRIITIVSPTIAFLKLKDFSIIFSSFDSNFVKNSSMSVMFFKAWSNFEFKSINYNWSYNKDWAFKEFKVDPMTVCYSLQKLFITDV